MMFAKLLFPRDCASATARPSQATPNGLFALGLLAVLLFTSGCVAPPVSYRVHADAPAKVAACRTIAIVTPDSEVSEISAGGVTEVRDEWSQLVARNLSQALAEESGFKLATALDPALQTELDDTTALLRAITLNHILIPFNPGVSRAGVRPLNYSLGPVDKLMDACQADALLFVFVRDSYATAGRKTLAALSVLAAGFTGVMILPSMGNTVTSGALVERDGTVLWFNFNAAATGDLRQILGARNTARVLLHGLPKK